MTRGEIEKLIGDALDILIKSHSGITPGEKFIGMACIALALATLRVGDEIVRLAGPAGGDARVLAEALEEFSGAAPYLAGQLRRLGGHESP
jgi:hypothetical protein